MTPEVGEIWKWLSPYDNTTTYTILLLEKIEEYEFDGMIVSEDGNGDVDKWHFRHMKDWTRLA